jgi:photosystem II stability/assembly factor-like uncharacterized protein
VSASLPRLLARLCLSSLLAVLPAFTAPALADVATNVLRWDLVGHIADQPIEWLAVPPDGLSSGVLFARSVETSTNYVLNHQVASGSTRRSLDAGKSWETIADAPGRVVLPPGGSPAFSLALDAVYRSTDAGSTWDRVSSVAAAELLFSPGFRQDGTVFLHGGDQLWRSTDAGLTWTDLDPGAGQAIVAVRLSPAFASDNTLVVGADSARPTGTRGNPLGAPPSDDADSLGVLISNDGGTTWSSLSDGLQIDGAPYRQVLDIAISPNFASDQSLYVSSLGPWQMPDAALGCPRCVTPSSAVFRTHDGGANWDAVNERSFVTYPAGGALSAALGPDNNTVLTESFSMRGSAPSQARCDLFVSTDSGDSWQIARAPGQSSGLCDVGAIAAAAGTSAVLAYQGPYYLSNEPNRNIEHSLDGGATWAQLSPPGDGLVNGFQSDLEQRQVILSDRVFQATQKGDLWQYAPLPPCAIQPTLGFGQVWQQHPEWQDAAGCPTAEEQPVQLQTRHQDLGASGSADTYWTSDGTACAQVRRDARGQLSAAPVSASTCTGTSDQQLSGALLPLANSQYWLYIADAPEHGLVVSSMHAVLEVTPDE